MDTLRYIQTELDELEREEKFNLKKVIDNRKKIQEEKDLKERMKLNKKDQDADSYQEEVENDNILDDNEDDILF